ncbi:DUF4296 domain-containing protein [Reichenbachiella versicolor]|uniref:DUF4296 domain-containing protein n=1 Tax=Reichenbachiella versicolor TaxID=1821036 RepID=UPI0021D3E613|nr:DUF4296 domain-containing protein [Reichenbachiella versicolor]
MLKNFIFGALVTLFFIQCSSRQNSEKILTRAQMVSVLTDIHILEAKVQQLSIRKKDSAIKIFNSYQLDLFEKHNVTKNQYERSYTYYAERPKELEAIYAIIVDSLNLQEQKINMLVLKQEELEALAEEARQDSIAQVKLRMDSLKVLADTLDISVDSLIFLTDSMQYNLDSLGLTGFYDAYFDSLARVDSIQLLADTLGISTDSLKYLGDSLGYTLDSIGMVGLFDEELDSLSEELIVEDSLENKEIIEAK